MLQINLIVSICWAQLKHYTHAILQDTFWYNETQLIITRYFKHLAYQNKTFIPTLHSHALSYFNMRHIIINKSRDRKIISYLVIYRGTLRKMTYHSLIVLQLEKVLVTNFCIWYSRLLFLFKLHYSYIKALGYGLALFMMCQCHFKFFYL